MNDFIDLSDLKILFPDNAASMKFLENLRWGKKPVCPHCGSSRITSYKKEHRHHCNSCNVSFSATVNTIFHNTRIPLDKWFAALALLFRSDKKISARKLASEINVNKNTAWQMLTKLNEFISPSGQKATDSLKLETVLKDVERTMSAPVDAFKAVIQKLLAQENG